MTVPNTRTSKMWSKVDRNSVLTTCDCHICIQNLVSFSCGTNSMSHNVDREQEWHNVHTNKRTMGAKIPPSLAPIVDTPTPIFLT